MTSTGFTSEDAHAVLGCGVVSVGFLAIALGLFAVVPFVVRWAWNAFLVPLFGVAVLSFWQTIAMVVLLVFAIAVLRRVVGAVRGQ